MTVDQFGKALVASGLMTADDVKSAWNSIDGPHPKDGEAFAALLVGRKLINDFQAKQVLAGRGGGLVMGEYVILGEIGAGGMGKVYKARHRRMDRIVALKVMSQAAMRDESSVKRFQREVRAAARLDHPNIVAALDAGEVGRTHFLVMQFVDGGDLSDLVKKNGPLPVEKAVDYVLQTARGLAFAHSEGVIHRDIKPANLLLDKKGVVRILDMGLARIEDGGEALTGTEQVMGTVDYMSPEQAAETKNADSRSDIYSLGCTLWYLLTAKKLYEGDTLVSRLMKHRDAPLPSLVKTRDDASWPLEQAFHRMIAKHAADRFQSMDEVVAALQPFAPGGSSPSVGGASSGIGLGMPPIVTGPPSYGSASYGSAPSFGTQPSAPPIAVQATAMPTAARVAATAVGRRAEADTDPKTSQLTMATARGGRRPATGGAGKKDNSRLMLIGAGFFGLIVVACFGVWVVVRDKEGNTVAEVKVPDGGSVEIKTPTATPVASKPPIAAPAANPIISPQPVPTATASFFATSTPAQITPSPAATGPIRERGSKPPRYRPPPTFGNWISLFDGKTLDGWTGDKAFFAVENLSEGPALVCLGSRGLLWTTREFADFEVACNFRVAAGANNGVGIRFAGSGDPSKDGLEIQILDDASMPGVRDDQRCGAVYRYASALGGRVKRAPEWNQLLVRAVGDEITVLINDQTVATADLADLRGRFPPDPGLSRTTGRICLFPISGRTEYRDLRIREAGAASSVATNSPRAPSSVAGSWVDLYNGRDLGGWKALVTSGSNYDVHVPQEGGWSVGGGVLRCATTVPGWLMTDREYGDFELELEYKNATGQSNSGVYLRAKPAGRISRTALEVQIDAAGPGTGGITPYFDPTTPVQKPPGQWNKLRIVCDGTKVQVYLNDVRVLNNDLDSHPELRLRPRSGAIGIANWNGLANGMEFRNLRLRELNVPATAATTSPGPSLPPSSGKPIDFAAWRGLPGYWKIAGSEVTGATAAGPSLSRNTYLVAPQTYRDFELTCRVNVIAGNSGIQIRSNYEDQGGFVLRGPQVDLGPGFWGSLYGELTDGMIRAADPAIGARVVKPNDFTDVLVRCYGKHVTIRLGGETTIDADFPTLPDEGFVGLQLHKGDCNVVFRDLMIRPLKPDGSEVATSASSAPPTSGGELQLVASVNSPIAEQDPWPSSDGLRLYVGRDNQILMFERASVDEPFGPGVFTVPGRMPTLPDDELQIYCVAKKPDGSERLVVHTRNRKTDKFGGSYDVTPLNTGGLLKAPMISPDGRTIYFMRWMGEESYLAVATRPNRQAAFGTEQKLNVKPPANSVSHLTWPWLSADGRTLLCGDETLDKSPGKGRLLRSTRANTSVPFVDFEPIVVGGRPLYGRAPRIVSATGDLIFGAPLQLGDESTWTPDDWDVRTVRGFATAPSPALPAAVPKATPSATASTRPTLGYKALFNGKDLTGWQFPGGGTGQWTVENGAITCKGGGFNRLFTERGDYVNFQLKAEVMINDGGNGGLHFRTPPGMGGGGYEAQVNSTSPTDPNRTGSIYIPGGGGMVFSMKQTLVPPNTWFTYEINVVGNRMGVFVDGKPVADYTDAANKFVQGHIALEHHDPQSKIQFRKVEIKELK